MRKIKAEKLSQEMFKEYGQILTIPDESVPTSLEGSGFKHRGELAFMDTHGLLEFGVTTFEKRLMVAPELEQHAKTPELLFAMDGPFVMPIALRTTQGEDDLPNEKSIKAIFVEQGQGIIFGDGVWHAAPYPLKEKSSVLVGFKKQSWKHDIILKMLADPIEIEV